MANLDQNSRKHHIESDTESQWICVSNSLQGENSEVGFYQLKCVARHSGDSRYADLMERLMYNGILSSPGLEGASYFLAGNSALPEAPPNCYVDVK